MVDKKNPFGVGDDLTLACGPVRASRPPSSTLLRGCVMHGALWPTARRTWRSLRSCCQAAGGSDIVIAATSPSSADALLHPVLKHPSK